MIMAALTESRDTPEIANGARLLALPVKAGTVVYDGSLVAVDANGFAVPAAKATGLTAAGRAETYADNSQGADGDVTVTVARGVYVWENSATNAVTAAGVLKTCYIEDDQTVSSLADGSSAAGKVIAVTEDGVAVETI